MKKLYLLGAVSALMLLANIDTADAGLVASDDPSFTAGAGETSARMLAASTSSLSGSASIPDELGGSGKIPPDENINDRKYGELPVRTQANPHMDLWLLLLVAAIAGIVSEIFHRRSCNR